MSPLASVTALLAFTSFVVSIASAMGKCPGWVPHIVISVTLLVMVFPK